MPSQISGQAPKPSKSQARPPRRPRADRGFIVFTRRAGDALEAWWGTREEFDAAVVTGYLEHTDWSYDHAPTERIEFESIMWAPPVKIMRPVGPGRVLQETAG